MVGKKPSSKIQKKPGRPAFEVKKVLFAIMLDPPYVVYFRSVAKKNNILPQELARMALADLFHSPYNRILGEISPYQFLKNESLIQVWAFRNQTWPHSWTALSSKLWDSCF